GWMDARIENQNQRNAYLGNEIKALDKQIEEINELDKTKSQLLTRKQIIEQLQSNRSQMVHLFDEMVKTIPDGVRLTTMKQAGDVLTLEGVAESNARVASYMRNIDNSPWMGRTDLRKIENKSGTKDIDKKTPYVFSLDVKLRKPEDATQKQVAEGEAPADAACRDRTERREAGAGDTARARDDATGSARTGARRDGEGGEEMSFFDDLRNLDRNNVGAWPKSIKTFFAIIIFAIIVAVGWYVWIRAQQDDLEKL